jgi:hypothetical protein
MADRRKPVETWNSPGGGLSPRLAERSRKDGMDARQQCSA